MTFKLWKTSNIEYARIDHHVQKDEHHFVSTGANFAEY